MVIKELYLVILVIGGLNVLLMPFRKGISQKK